MSFSSQKTAELPEQLERREPAMPTALAGVRVVDFTHFVAGPYATMMLADFGAEVIKIEKPGSGDSFRKYPPVDRRAPDSGAPFLFCNRNKRSVVLDMKNSTGLRLAKELVRRADVLVENFSTGVMSDYGLDYDACKELNPRLIYCSIPAYARDGSHAARAGFDAVAQAESGYIESNGYDDRPGTRSFSPIMDISTGLVACTTILAALNARRDSGVGQYCEVALFDASLTMLGYAPMQYLLTGIEPKRNGNASPDTSPSSVFSCSDASFYLNGGTDPIFRRLAIDVLESPSLLEDPRFSDLPGRIANREALTDLLQHEFAKHPWRYWHARFERASVPCGKVKTMPEALAGPEVLGRGSICRIPHPELDWIPDIRPAARMSGTPVADAVAAPTLGQHTKAVMREVFEASADELAALAAAGAFGAKPPI